MALLLTNTGASVDLLLFTGANFSKTITYKTNNVVTNIAGYAFAGQIRTQAGALVASFTFTIVNAAQGLFSMTMPVATIASMTIGTTYVWNMEVTISGITSELMRGYVNVTNDPTQP